MHYLDELFEYETSSQPFINDSIAHNQTIARHKAAENRDPLAFYKACIDAGMEPEEELRDLYNIGHNEYEMANKAPENPYNADKEFLNEVKRGYNVGDTFSQTFAKAETLVKYFPHLEKIHTSSSTIDLLQSIQNGDARAKARVGRIFQSQVKTSKKRLKE